MDAINKVSKRTLKLMSPFQSGSLPDEFWVSVLKALEQGLDDLTMQPGGSATSESGQLFEEKRWPRPSPELCALRLTCRRFSNDLSALFTDLHVKKGPIPASAWAVRFSRVRRITVHVNDESLDPVDLSWLQTRSHARVLEDPSSVTINPEAVPAIPVQRVPRAQVEQVTVHRSISSWKPEIISRMIELPSRQLLDEDEPLGSLQEASERGGEAPPCCGAVQDTVKTTVVHNSIHLTVLYCHGRRPRHHLNCQAMVEGRDIIPAAVTSISLLIRHKVSPEEVASLLPRLPPLRKLEFQESQHVSDEHLVAIGASSAPELKVLTVRGTRELTDRGLMALAGIPSLTRIERPHSSTTSAGVRALKKLIPGVRVYR